ncbi:MAG TPA: TonB-dependent receptor [Candidatus Tidjanibacter faecipullorum]|uniref:TonB-dependent receptor n=1 Tax=Candidatus Tidjanibacter faecipullorum TaxID=2838766 RepID=A0A9D2DDG2_9BACT|nr:TonB-dependent receptor [Candidatus Tidjanibacter faecipullorum]
MGHFTRWTRKPYGAFASLGKVVKIGVLSLTMSIVTHSPKSVAAQPDSLEVARVVELEALNVTAERLNPTRGVTTPTEVYSRDTLSVAPLQTIESVLRINPAVDLRERGAKGMQADISVRGGTYDQTLILLNGIDFTDARTGHQSHSLPVDLDIIGEIDFITGLTGIGAFSGALNFITTPLRPNYLRAELSGGAYGYLYSNISGAFTRNGLSVLAAGSIRRSDGYTHNTDFFNSNLYSRITYQSASVGLIDAQVGYQWRDFGANSFYSTAFPDQFEHTETQLASIRWSRNIGMFTLNANVSYRKNFDRYELYRAGKGAPDGWTPNYHTTDNAGAEISVDYRWRWGTSSIGADYKYNHLYSNVLGELMAAPIPVPGADAVYTREKGRHIINGWLSHRMRLGSTSLAGSFNLSHSEYGTFPSGSLAVSQQLLEGWDVEADLTRSMRLPTYTDLYYTTATHIGNPNLKAEQATTYQLGTHYRYGRFQIGASGFFRQGSNMIDWRLVETPEGQKWQSTQLTRLNTYGVELLATYRGRRILRHVTLSYGWLNSNKDTHDITKYALDFMNHKVALQCGVNIWRGLSAEVTASWYDRKDTADTIYKPYWLLDARLSWTQGAFTFYVEATNLCNTVYYDFVGVIQPPRWISGGVVMTL